MNSLIMCTAVPTPRPPTSMFTFSGLSSRTIFRTQPATSMFHMPARFDFHNAAPTPPCYACSIWSHAGRIDADNQAPTKIIFDPLFPRFNNECRWNEAIERTGNKSLARNEGKLLGQTLAELLLLRTPPSDLCVFKSVQRFEFNLLSSDRKIFIRLSSILWV